MGVCSGFSDAGVKKPLHSSKCTMEQVRNSRCPHCLHQRKINLKSRQKEENKNPIATVKSTLKNVQQRLRRKTKQVRYKIRKEREISRMK